MEGWRQRWLGSKEDHSRIKGDYTTVLTLTGLLMEGLMSWLKPRPAKNIHEMSSSWWRPRDWNIFCWLGLLRALHGCVFNSMALGAEEPACGILCGACQRLKPVYFGCFAARLKACPTRIC